MALGDEMANRWAEVLLFMAEQLDDTAKGADFNARPAILEVLREASDVRPDVFSAHSLWFMDIITDDEHAQRCDCQ